MKVQVTREWCEAMTRREGDLDVGAGQRAPHDESEEASLASAGTRIAFGRFIHLIRRLHGMSVEQLAQNALLDLAELVRIEEDVHYVPEPRSVHQLALTFHVPQQRLMQLAGLALTKSERFRMEAVKFAARSESAEALSNEERQALEQFIRVLSERKED